MEIKTKVTLRKEAEPTTYPRLTSSQGEALATAIQYLAEALEHSNAPVNADRRSRVLLVSGSKGSGKTTFLLTLKNLLESGKALSFNENDLGDWDKSLAKVRMKEISDIQTAIGNTQLAFRWLAPLALDPLSRGTNLAAAVLARIYAAASAQGADEPSRAGLLDPVGQLDHARTRLENLQNTIVTALEGNLHERGGAVSGDTYSVDALDAERYKLAVAASLNEILGSVVSGPGQRPDRVQSLFVLPIDDLDVRPSRAVEALRLASLLSIPRLFFLFLGSVDALDQVLFFETQAEYFGLFKHGAGYQAAAADIEAKSNEVASNLLRKLVPPAQRIFLESMTLAEAKKYPFGFHEKPKPEQERTLSTILQASKHDVKLIWKEKEKEKKKKNKTPPRESPPEASHSLSALWMPDIETESFYDGTNLFIAPPRQVADIRQRIAEAVPAEAVPEQADAEAVRKQAKTDAVLEQAKASNQVFGFLKETLVQLIDEDPHLGVEVQRAIKSCIVGSTRAQSEVASRWKMLLPPLRMVSTLGESVTIDLTDKSITFDSTENSVFRAGIVAREVMTHELECRVPGSPEPPFRRLGPASRPALKLAYDFLRMTEIGPVAPAEPGASLVKHENRGAIAHTVWEDGISEPFEIAWSTSDWPTFRHLDLSTWLWNQGVRLTGRIAREKADLGELELTILLLLSRALATLESATSHVRVSLPDYVKATYKAEKVGDEWMLDRMKFPALATGITGAFKSVLGHVVSKRADGEYDSEAAMLEEALLDVMCLLTPEVAGPVLMEGASVKVEARSALKGVLDTAHATTAPVPKGTTNNTVTSTWKSLQSRAMRRRLSRMGERIATPLGYALLTATGEAASKLNITWDQFGKAVPTELIVGAFHFHRRRGWSKAIDATQVEEVRKLAGMT